MAEVEASAARILDMRVAAANVLAIWAPIPHIDAIVTGAWTFNGSAGAKELVTDFTSYPLR